MRALSFALAASLLVAGFLAVACEERFPDSLDRPPAGDGPLETTPPALIPAELRRDATSTPVAFDAERGGVWTANGDVGSVSYVDVDARVVRAEIPVGKDVRSVGLSPDARWVAAVDRDAGSVALLDAEARVVRRTLSIGSHPRAVVWDPENPRFFYVAVEDDDAVVVVDRMQPSVVGRIPVGRLPAGLAASRLRPEIAVLHRIDARVTVVDRAARAVAAEIPLADQPSDPDPRVPQGRPFGFEGLAWTPDGASAWLPHMLLAPRQPIQFDETLFPAVSVVSLASRAEVQTDPADPNGAIAGRKNLFDAINLLDTTANASIVSQPCAAALHPNGLLGYVLACASEDLLVFDAARGVATDLLRDLPGDHPVGLTLDDTGQRLFILSDQSHSLVMVDTAGGSPVARAHVAGGAIPLVARDPVDPALRAGLKLFYSANSDKGPFAVTGNHWMSCGGCHLDGFVSTNLAFFEALRPADPTKEARLGHQGLEDLFASAPNAGTVAFDPHDVLAAMLEQGGLAPDRTGKNREGEVDPGDPSDALRTAAAGVARVIARDLPVGPSWLLNAGQAPNPDEDGAWCGRCHGPEYAAWKVSAHAHAAEDPMVIYGKAVEQELRGASYPRLCAGCHDPVSARLGDSSMETKRGVTCLGCHEVGRTIRAGGNADLQATGYTWEQDHKARGLASLELLRKPELCGGCHQQFVPGTGVTAIGTLTEFQASPHAKGGATCASCHAPVTNGVADHRMAGGNVYLGRMFGDDALVAAQTKNLKDAVAVQASRTGDGVRVTLTGGGAGHAFPTGVTDVREPWVEVQAVDGAGNVLARYGGPDAAGEIPIDAPGRLGMDLATADGTLLFRHELSDTVRIPFDRHVTAGGTEALTIPVPTTLPTGTSRLEAVLRYRNVRTQYYRRATGQAQATAPDLEITRVAVE